MLEITILLIIILLIALLILSKEKHTFWDKQPVMRNYNNRIGIIGVNNKFAIKLKDNDLDIKITNSNFDEIYKFLDRNFSNNFNINYNFFKSIYHINGCINITLYKGHNVIGFIHSHPIRVKYNDTDIDFMYVDYLCIEKKFRNQNAAVVLISSLINSVNNIKMPFIFKKDTYPLPFSYILKSYYYYNDMNDISIKPDNISNIKYLSNDNIDKYFQYTNDLMNRYQLRKLYNYNEFKRVFLEEKILEYYIIENKNTTNNDTIVIGKKNKYNYLGQEYVSFDTDMILGDLEDCKNIWNELSNILKINGYNFITIPHIASNIVFIQKNNFQKANSFYYYTYNFDLPLIPNHDFCFNLN